MNWITNYVRPKLQALVRKAEVPDNLWDKCPACEKMIFHRDLEANHRVCTHCGHHMRLPAKRRLEMLFDDGAYARIELPRTIQDPLRFRDRKRYTDRLKEARDRTQEQDAIIVAHGTIGGTRVVVAIFNFDFQGGSMGIAVGEGFLAAAKLAVLQQAPLIAIPASGGARMQEGLMSLMQMAKTTAALSELAERHLPYVSVLTDPTMGGVSASFCFVGDVVIAEPKALIGFAGPRVIEQTVREKLPEGFQRAEFLLEKGAIDMIVDRRHMREEIARLLALLLKQPTEALS